MDSLRLLFKNDGLEDYDDEMEVTEAVPVIVDETPGMVVEPALESEISPVTEDFEISAPSSQASHTPTVNAAENSLPEVAAPLVATLTPPATTSSSAQEASGSIPKSLPVKCRVCNQSHPLYGCTTFKKLSEEERLRKVTVHRYCTRCLSPHHLARSCKSTGKCKYCKGRHHSLLHTRKRTNNVKSSTKKPETKRGQVSESPLLNLPVRHMVTFSPTAKVFLKVGNKNIPIRAVIDLCCSRSYICDELVKALHLPTTSLGTDKLSFIHIRSIHDSKLALECMVKVTRMNKIKTPVLSVS